MFILNFVKYSGETIFYMVKYVYYGDIFLTDGHFWYIAKKYGEKMIWGKMYAG